jgi:hypothetical protein
MWKSDMNSWSKHDWCSRAVMCFLGKNGLIKKVAWEEGRVGMMQINLSDQKIYWNKFNFASYLRSIILFSQKRLTEQQSVQNIKLTFQTSCNTILRKRITVFQLFKKSPAFCETFELMNVHCSVYMSPPMDFILKYINPIYVFMPSFFTIHFNNILPLKMSFSLGFPSKISY